LKGKKGEREKIRKNGLFERKKRNERNTYMNEGRNIK
jgi:hypothetical protein